MEGLFAIGCNDEQTPWRQIRRDAPENGKVASLVTGFLGGTVGFISMHGSVFAGVGIMAVSALLFRRGLR